MLVHHRRPFLTVTLVVVLLSSVFILLRLFFSGSSSGLEPASGWGVREPQQKPRKPIPPPQKGETNGATSKKVGSRRGVDVADFIRERAENSIQKSSFQSASEVSASLLRKDERTPLIAILCVEDAESCVETVESLTRTDLFLADRVLGFAFEDHPIFKDGFLEGVSAGAAARIKWFPAKTTPFIPSSSIYAERTGLNGDEKISSSPSVRRIALLGIALERAFVLSDGQMSADGLRFVIFVTETGEFSVDFVSYFRQMEMALVNHHDLRSSVFCVGAANQLYERTHQAQDERRLLRTDVFSQPVFMVSNVDAAVNILPYWPIVLRRASGHLVETVFEYAMTKMGRWRDCIIPEVPRFVPFSSVQSNHKQNKQKTSQTNSKTNTLESQSPFLAHGRVFWREKEINRLREGDYVDVMSKMLQMGLIPASWKSMEENDEKSFMWIIGYKSSSRSNEIGATADWNVLADALGLSRTFPPEGSHRGLVGVWNHLSYIVLIPEWSPYFSMIQRADTPDTTFRPLPLDSVREMLKTSRDVDNELLPYLRLVKGDFGENCDEVCKNHDDTECSPAFFKSINQCEVMKSHFSCERCASSGGFEQPAFVRPDAPKGNFPNECVINDYPNDYPFKCSASHSLTARLCPCLVKKENRKGTSNAWTRDDDLAHHPEVIDYDWMGWSGN